ncbi:type II CAAX endopeptidase family protein [Paenibacillus larvae]
MKIKPGNRYLVFLAIIGIILYLSVAFIPPADEIDDEAYMYENSPLLSKKEAADKAVIFLNDKQMFLENPVTYTVYQSESNLSGYIQKENLTGSYEDFKEKFPLEYYLIQVIDGADGRQFEVKVDFQTGAVVGWYSKPDQLDPPTEDQAETIGRKAIQDMGWPQEQFKLTGLSTPEADLVFEQQQPSIGGAHLRIQVQLDHNMIAGVSPDFAIPDSFIKWMDSQTDTAGTMTLISMLLNIGMTISAVIYVILKRRQIAFHRGVLLCTVYLVLYSLNNVNLYPTYKVYKGHFAAGWESMFSVLLMNMLIIVIAVFLYFLLLAGNQMWQEQGWRPIPRWKDRNFGNEVLSGMGRGYLLCLFLMGLQQLLFFIADKNFRVWWSVSDPGDSPLNMLNPCIYPLMAWVAAISEEATFRLFGIILFKKLFRNNFIAILVPSIIWAAGHTQYPVFPVYTRLIEVTILGIVFGYAFLKFGFFTALFAHAAMDSTLMGLYLMTVGNDASLFGGIFYMILPALVAGVLWLFHKWLLKGIRFAVFRR